MAAAAAFSRGTNSRMALQVICVMWLLWGTEAQQSKVTAAASLMLISQRDLGVCARDGIPRICRNCKVAQTADLADSMTVLVLQTNTLRRPLRPGPPRAG